MQVTLPLTVTEASAGLPTTASTVENASDAAAKAPALRTVFI
jgi:hypothetical protein